MKKLFLLGLLSFTIFSCTKDEIEPIPTPSSTILTGNITESVTLTADKEWTLKGYVYVVDGVTLTIQPGTTIKSDISEKGALCIERGAKLIADGTASNPIIFTSGRPVGERAPGDWGGVVILGRATTNRSSEPTIEGGIGRPYGGTNDDDNSGILRYVRIEYAGIAAMPNSEINGLTLGAVGRGTTLDHIQTVYANDDAFEFFGGTVNPTNLYAYATADDDFDFDFGFRGTLTNCIAKRVPNFVDGGDAGNGIECDNDGTGTSAQPFTHPILQGLIVIGPNDASSLPNHNLAMRWRRATQFEVYNSIFIGHMKGGFSMESDETAQSYKDGISKLQNNIFASYNGNNFISKSAVISSADVKTKALVDGNTEKTYSTTEVETLSKPTWTNGWTRFPSIGN